MILQNELADHWRKIGNEVPTIVKANVRDALAYASACAKDLCFGSELHVLVTGEPHLVGSSLFLLKRMSEAARQQDSTSSQNGDRTC